MPDSIPLHHVLWIKDIRRPDLPPKPPPELIQGRMGTVIPEFHLNRQYLLPFRDKKVDLYVIFPMQIVTVGVEVKQGLLLKRSVFPADLQKPYAIIIKNIQDEVSVYGKTISEECKTDRKRKR